jgi:hypothetical protein
MVVCQRAAFMAPSDLVVDAGVVMPFARMEVVVAKLNRRDVVVVVVRWTGTRM